IMPRQTAMTSRGARDLGLLPRWSMAFLPLCRRIVTSAFLLYIELYQGIPMSLSHVHPDAERLRAAPSMQPQVPAEAQADVPSATASPQGDMISVQPMLISPSRSTAAGTAKA